MKVKWFGWTVFALLMLTWSATATTAAAQDSGDLGIALDISRQIERYPQFTIFDHVTGTVDNGVVTLTGKVTMPFKKNDIAKRAGSVNGVREVLNRIDDDLRQRIARAIYGNSAFWQYGAMANPPIHIIVERGHVTLTGVVNSNVDRMLARSLAIGFGELSVTNDLRTDAELRSN